MMNEQAGLNAKTTLEYLVLVNEQSYSQIGRELNITPQQFSDWIKKRRPIPQERLNALSDYFEIEEKCLVDEKSFARNLNSVTQINIQMLMLKKVMERAEEDVTPYEEKMKQLEKEKTKQIRIARLASLLHKENQQIDKIIDAVLDQIESGNLEKLSRLTH